MLAIRLRFFVKFYAITEAETASTNCVRRVIFAGECLMELWQRAFVLIPAQTRQIVAGRGEVSSKGEVTMTNEQGADGASP